MKKIIKCPQCSNERRWRPDSKSDFCQKCKIGKFIKPPKTVKCLGCGKDRKWYAELKTDYCQKCNFDKFRCPKCKTMMGADGVHQCKSVDEKGDRFCNICNRLLRNKSWERYQKICGSCSKTIWREKERSEKRILQKEFGGKCSVCSYDKCFAALHFHHMNNSEKYNWTRKGQGGASVAEVKAHPERFQLVCANCHTELHEKERTKAREKRKLVVECHNANQNNHQGPNEASRQERWM